MPGLYLILFLPASCCLFWMVFITLAKRRSSTYAILMALALDLMLFFISDAIYSIPGISSDYIVYTHLVTLFTAPCVIPLIWLYLHRIRHRKDYRTFQFIWLVVPIALLFAGISLTGACGMRSASAFLNDVFSNGLIVLKRYSSTLLWHYYLWTVVFFRAFVAVELFVASLYFVHYLRSEKLNLKTLNGFLRKGGFLKISHLQVFCLIVPFLFVAFKVVLSKHFIDANPWISVILAIVVSLGFFDFLYVSLVDEKENVTLFNLRNVILYNYNYITKNAVIKYSIDEIIDEVDRETLKSIYDKIGDALPKSEDTSPKDTTAVQEHLFVNAIGSWDDSLVTRFQTLMLNEQLYLQPSLSLADVADRLHTNKTYVSKMVNNTYKVGFPEFLNTLRVDYAKQYIINHPDARQDEIAQACGFLSASAFNNTFKKITGMTPKLWQGSYLQNEAHNK